MSGATNRQRARWRFVVAHSPVSEDMMRYTNDAVNPHDLYLIGLYERLQRDPVSPHPDDVTRATVPMGRWQRFHPGQQLVYVDDMEGNPRAVTPKQRQVMELALSTDPAHKMLTMRQMAEILRVAPSTVSRALTKLQAWGILAYIVGRGRFAGLVIIRRSKGDGFDYLRRAAKERIKRWREASKARFSRLVANVALYIPFEEWERHGLGHVYVDGMNATLTKPWTVDDLEGIE